MTTPEIAPPSTKFVGFALIGLILVVFGLGIPSSLSYEAQIAQYKQAKRADKDANIPDPTPPTLMVLAIALGTLLPLGLAIGVAGMAAAAALKNRSHETGDNNFSSLSPDVERAFVPQEKRLLANRAYANLVGSIGGAVLLVVVVGNFVLFYTPCSRMCERPPASCRTSEQAAQFMRSCEQSCSSLRAQRGTELVETLTACASAGATDKNCAEPTRAGIAAGLVCESK
jgi:hypothetical protein